MSTTEPHVQDSHSLLDRIIRFFLRNKLVVALLLALIIGWGVSVAPFDWNIPFIVRSPVPVDAIPDIGENQQIVFTDWPGRSPQDVEDQITYPLTTALLGVAGVRTVRSYSMFGFSTIYIIFREDIDFYWSRSRILEKLSSLPPGLLPRDVQPRLGPDATPLGQIFWYTLEGRDARGNPTGGWDLDELRSIQDWQVRLALQSVEGVGEVASVGGFVREYQVDVDPDALRAHRVTIKDVAAAVQRSNLDVGAGVIEQNRVEYALRSLGFVQSVEDIENSVVQARDHVPIRVGDVAHVSIGPSLRRGALDKGGAEVVGGVVVVRYGENPLAVIKRVKKKIETLAPALPRKTLPDGTVSQVAVVPFYDRTDLIHETLGTLNTALYLQVLVTTIVVLVMVHHFASSLLIATVMPLAVLAGFIAMRVSGVDANIVSLSGIAIAIGTLVDMGIVLCENILSHIEGARADGDSLSRDSLERRIFNASSEVGSAILTAVATTVVGFLPVFAMEGPEGKLFKPLAFTKTFVLIASLLVALLILPALAHLFFGRQRRAGRGVVRWGTIVFVLLVLAMQWAPVGHEKGRIPNFLFAGGIIASLLVIFVIFQRYYARILRRCLDHRRAFLTLPLLLLGWGLLTWLGFERVFGWVPRRVRAWGPVSYIAHKFPGLGREFMPGLDEGSFLFMPTAMPHASIAEVLDILKKQDMAFEAIPEIKSAVGKLGRVESPLDPAPVPMIETVIHYHPRFLTDARGRRMLFRYDPNENDYVRTPDGRPVHAPDGQPYKVRGKFLRDAQNRLIPDARGKPFPLWRPPLDPSLNPGRKAWSGVRTPNDIWDLITAAGSMPGVTTAPRLQPIAARLVMLQSGMRSSLGIKVFGPTLEAVESGARDIERILKEVPMINPKTVIADRVIGRPYLEIVPDRTAIARYGVRMEDFQEAVEMVLGGQTLTYTVEGRERYPIRIRYMRELRDSVENIERILVPAFDGTQIPLSELAAVRYERGPDMIKSEDTALIAYVLFDRRPQYSEVDVVEQARKYLDTQRETGRLVLPAGVSYVFSGNFENQVRAQKKLAVILPVSLAVIFLILYFQFRNPMISLFVFSGIFVAWAGGFILIWFYNQPWFLDFSILGVNLRELFQIRPVNLSVAIWVGFLALFGIASDDGVVMCTYLNQRFAGRRFQNTSEIRQAVVEAGLRRVRPCLMTTATTVLALLPVLSSSGRGSDIMIPMAIPSFGGMVIEILTMLVVPVLYGMYQERRLLGNRH